MKYVQALLVFMALTLSGCFSSGVQTDSGMPAHPSTTMMYKSAPMSQSATYNTEKYHNIEENSVKNVSTSPLSTFSVDVDTASYTNIKRYIKEFVRFPPKGAVRIEEMINYFSYDYKTPKNSDKHPFSITTELADAPWDSSKKLLLIGLKAKEIAKSELPSSNLVALVDVSGSMTGNIRLVQNSLKILTKNLKDSDRLSIVTYAGNVEVLLKPTSGEDKDEIIKAIDKLNAQGYTNGAQGMQKAYDQAKKYYKKDGNNRVIMFTDGDFNVGQTSESEIVDLVEKERENDIFLSVIGYGAGNYNDAMMEQVADKGNGNFSYVRNLLDAKKVFSKELSGTLYTLAKDVKIQVEFNPTAVKSYRLIGYENRLLENEDFDDDKKDAGEIGVGHSVTALYELALASSTSNDDTLRYQTTQVKEGEEIKTELGFVKFRYKKPDGDSSILIEHAIDKEQSASNNIKFASAVAAYGFKLREHEIVSELSYDDIIKQAKEAKGIDDEGYRAEFIKLVEETQLIMELESKRDQ